ncbi:hypothetical protein C7Y47_04455 [Lysinibacillus sphaericus]|uniref:Uncharacterized protein n=1 Tax=Lysinibacillus sphaericus TaxID=1421 RepID=A0A544UT01_LYSSH|nr:hypothetical protein [Lysinibacillus sp. SDF0037]TQR36969.1 hypothetical protein C7Y47_04455 [Lysinibacillus sp. SDF0037]
MIIKPTKKVLLSWIESYVPERDLFFLSKKHLNHEIDFTDVLLIPTDEFYTHSTYQQLNYVNSYEYWNNKNAQYVIIAEKEWIESLSKEEQQLILALQVPFERGLVLPVKFIKEIEKVPSIYIQNGHVIIQRSMWEGLDETFKEQLLTTMVYEWWDKGECEEPPKSLPSFLKPFANVFGHIQGANCLAAVLFAISKGKQKWFIYEWIYQETFLEQLSQYKYEEFFGEGIHPGDIVIWKDENGIIQHAAYHIDEELYFNKHGQTMFNPWKVLSKEQVYKEWEHLTPVKYRQSN